VGNYESTPRRCGPKAALPRAGQTRAINDRQSGGRRSKALGDADSWQKVSEMIRRCTTPFATTTAMLEFSAVFKRAPARHAADADGRR